MDRLSLDYTLCMEDGLTGGISSFLLEAYRLPLQKMQAAIEEAHKAGDVPWLDLPQRETSDILAYAKQARQQFDTLVVLGIGGSALGTTALTTALLHPFHNLLPSVERKGVPRVFVVDNVDPDQIAGLYEHLDLRTTLFNVASKSGSTAETMAAYLVARKLLEQSVGRIRLSEHFVFTTDPFSGVLRELAHSEGIRAFGIPTGVGGRFSVLSAVGLLPAAIAGIDVLGLLEGARVMQAWIDEADVISNPAYLYALMLFIQQTRYQRSIDVMMPYAAALRDVADWYRQLWAESLGKAYTRHGATIHAGLTPVKALGATDQHSQIQLYTEGPDDKVVTFLRVEEFRHEVPVPAPPAGGEELAYLSGHTMAEILNAEQEATAWALARHGRPSMTITLPRIDAGAVGQLLYLLQMATAVAGELYEVDAYDQPGVELGKEATYALMGRAGYESLAEDIRPSEEGDARRRYLLA